MPASRQLQAEVACPRHCELGESPLWNGRDKHLYWTDIPRRQLIRFQPQNAQHEALAMPGHVAGFTLQGDGALLLFMEEGRIARWRDGEHSMIVEGITALAGSRFNDVIADPAGRVFCGTMPGKNGMAKLYRLNADQSLTLMVEGLGLANGMGFNLDATGLYVTDTEAGEIRLFDYDARTGNLGDSRVFVRVTEGGKPDGLTVDAEGYVWSARWGGNCVVRYSPAGAEDCRVAVPAANVTSVAFGGEDLGDLYITTAGVDTTPDTPDGFLFHVRPGVHGRPEFVSRIGLPAAPTHEPRPTQEVVVVGQSDG